MNVGFTLNVKNSVDEKPVVYRNTAPCSLAISLSNDTGTDLQLFPDMFTLEVVNLGFTAEELKVIGVKGFWEINAFSRYLELTYTGSLTWFKGTVLTVEFTQIFTQAACADKQMQVNLCGIPQGDVEVFTPFSIVEAPKPGNGNLNEVLQLSFDYQGLILVSPINVISEEKVLDPLKNTLMLNMKNIGKKPLFCGTAPKGNSHINVTFLYGNGAGCLAPDQGKDIDTSAWKIKASVATQLTDYPWNCSSEPLSRDGHPYWILEPTEKNLGILGTDENSNIPFAFKDIVSPTAAGHTQAILTFSGFMMDDDTPYDDAMFVLDIIKQDPPLSRGVVRFFCHSPIVEHYQPDSPVKFNLQWLAYYANTVQVMVNAKSVPAGKDPGMDPNSPVTNGVAEVELDHVIQSTYLVATIYAFNRNGVFLNSMQFTLIVRTHFFTDIRDNKCYPAERIGNLLWMKKNLNYLHPQGSKAPPASSDPETYGRYYRWEASAPGSGQDGWRLPTVDEWKAWMKEKKYDEVVKELGIVAGGLYSDRFERFGETGYYWAQGIGNEVYCATFNNKTERISVDKMSDEVLYMSVRYVREVPVD